MVDETTQHLSAQLLACFDGDSAPDEAALDQRFRALLESVLVNPANQALVTYLSKLAKCPGTSLYDVMETNFMYNLSLAEFAQLANRSLPTFKREFKRLFDITPGHWLMQKRLAHARVLLKTTEKSVGDIVLESGFESAPHFSRVFKNQVGQSPLHYRRASAVS